jgi:hypothetical protein
LIGRGRLKSFAGGGIISRQKARSLCPEVGTSRAVGHWQPASVEVTAARNAPVVSWGHFKQREIENGGLCRIAEEVAIRARHLAQCPDCRTLYDSLT